MTREKAQDEILERLDEIQQILDLYDPMRKGMGFQTLIERRPDRSIIIFTLMSTDEDGPLLSYTEENLY